MKTTLVGRRARLEARPATLHAVFACSDGKVFDLPNVEAAADRGMLSRAEGEDFIPIPEGTLLLTLPGRSVVGFSGHAEAVIGARNGEDISAVAAALPLGYTRLALPAYVERDNAPTLPLYGYTAVAWCEAGFFVAAQRTDRLENWLPEQHADEAVRDAIALRSFEFPGNMLLRQLERCATEYGCFTAQNAFLRQGEAAIPVSPACNARCIGCISEQEPDAQVKSAQERVRRTPSLEEICDFAVAHLEAAPEGLISFGQGCEGEPLLAAPLIEQSIRRIRSATTRGAIHCNTNASNSKALVRLIDAGLQSIRVSLNSARPQTYAAYYRPRGYGLDDVLESIRIAADRGIKVSLNLLTHPGVTDDDAEMKAFAKLLYDYPIGMVQTRTLNVDPALYFAAVGRPRHKPFGMRKWLDWLRNEFPNVKVGNFTRGFG